MLGVRSDGFRTPISFVHIDKKVGTPVPRRPSHLVGTPTFRREKWDGEGPPSLVRTK
ncbi:MAG: hypothetical protein Fur0032_23410 [Terrimicrobiaceae bacterium]